MASLRPISTVLLSLFLASLCWTPALAQLDPLAAGVLEIQGNRLALYADAQTTDAEQTINVGEQARVRTCYGGPSVPCGALVAGDPRIAGLKVVAELSGPELPQAITLETVPGGSFFLPSFQQEGDYRLESIRMIDDATGEVLSFAEPSVALLHVRKIVVAGATVRALSLAELRARGIEFNDTNFQAFDFAVGFAIAGEVVELEFPVVYDGEGLATIIAKPDVRLDDLPEHVAQIVERWEPPRVVPFRLVKPPGEPEDQLAIGNETDQGLVFPLFGAIVIPGTVTFLNQFFDAQLVVANGAPAGSGVTLERLTGALRLPNGNVVRIAETAPPVGPGQPVPVVGPTGSRVFAPGEQGTANWTIEGLRPGTHSLTIDINGEVERPGREPLPVLSRVQAAVEVVDARFNLTFSHPDVVREGEEYTLYVTVTNLSSVPQNLITIDLREENITGAVRADLNDNLIRTIQTLAPGQAETVEYELVSLLTGKVVATTYQSDSTNFTGTIRLRTGVGELGIPLSPASLVLPRFSEYLRSPHYPSDELVKANLRLLGLAYSLAVAPPALIPSGLPNINKSDVERRALDLAEAGERLYLGDQRLETLEALILDQLGNRHDLESYDRLRRQLNKSLRASARLADDLRAEQVTRGLYGLDLLDHFATTMSYGRPFLAAMVEPADAAAPPSLEIYGPAGQLIGTADQEASARRTLPWAEMYSVAADGAPDNRAALAVIGRVEPSEVFAVRLKNDGNLPAAGRLVVIVPDGATRTFRRIDLGVVTVPAGGVVAVDAGALVADPSSGFGLYDPATGTGVTGSAQRTTVELPTFRIVGIRQTFNLDEKFDALGNPIRPNRYGNGLSYLFNRPPALSIQDHPQAWAIRSFFEGLDENDQPASGMTEKEALAVYIQPNSERVAHIRYAGGISPVKADDGSPLVELESLVDSGVVRDEFGEALDANLPDPVLETTPNHFGGPLAGRVVRGTGQPAANATIELIRLRRFITPEGFTIKYDLVDTTTTDAQGRFFFAYVEKPHWDGFIENQVRIQARVPEGADPITEPAQEEFITFEPRRQNRMARVNIALLGRGAITGRLVYADTQQPVPEGQVTAASVLFSEIKSAEVAADGSFSFIGLPVGPITLTGVDKAKRRVYATVEIARSGSVVDVLLEMPRTAPPGLGTVKGRVLLFRDGQTTPIEGAKVSCYVDGKVVGSRTTQGDGAFIFSDVPAGPVKLQAADFRVSRTALITDFDLGVGEVEIVELRLPEAQAKSVTGLVLSRDVATSSVAPVQGAVAFIPGPGVFAYTDDTGRYQIDGVPVQSAFESNFRLNVIDFANSREADISLPKILEVSPDLISAETIVFESGDPRGKVRGVVLDPFGNPASNVDIVLFPLREGRTAGDGSFVFDNVPLGNYALTAHVGNGLEAGKEGWIGSVGGVNVLHPGHEPFVSVPMRGSGFVKIHTRTQTATGILTPIYYKPTYYSEAEKSIRVRGSFFETTTDQNGMLEVKLPVGAFEVVAFNPFHGIKTIKRDVEYAGQVIDLDIVFEDAGTVSGTVLDVDGVTPLPDVEISLRAGQLDTQRQQTDAFGRFRFELVPQGPVVLRARGTVGNVERVGQTYTMITSGGQEIDVNVRMKAQGSIRGKVVKTVNGVTSPLPFARLAIQEAEYPFRRLPEAENTYYIADASGEYQVSRLFAGRINISAFDPTDVGQKGTTSATIINDWSVVNAPDIVFNRNFGTIEVLVRDPATGGPVADAQVSLVGQGYATVSDSTGKAVFEALTLRSYTIYVFDAPTGRSGRLGGQTLSQPGQRLESTVYLDSRGEIRGTLWSDLALTTPIAGGTVKITGQTAGGYLEALATTSGRDDQLGRFAFLGIPEGTFSLTAAEPTSPRRASSTVSITDTSPIQVLNIVLEPVGLLHLKLFESLQAEQRPVDTASSLFSVRVTQGEVYNTTLLSPDSATGNFIFDNVLINRAVEISAVELTGEQRSRFLRSDITDLGRLPGANTAADPKRVTLSPKGTVRVLVRDASATPLAGANVRAGSSSGATGADGTITFVAVPAGFVYASATNPLNGQGGAASGSLTFDDQVLDLTIQLAPSVSATGVIFQPTPGDLPVSDPATLVPFAGAIVSLQASGLPVQTVLTAADGSYRFDGLTIGNFTLTAQNNNGDQLARKTGSLVGPNGNLNNLGGLILDASPPRVVSIVPSPGSENVSRLANVEVVISEPLLPSVLPNGPNHTGPFLNFRLIGPANLRAPGVWSSFLNAEGQQVIRFVPSEQYINLALYSLAINGMFDLANRQLSSTQIGATFRTSDSVGPAIVGFEPTLDKPVVPTISIRVDFSEKVVADAEMLNGDGVLDAAVLEAQRIDGTWATLPVALFLTRNDFSLQVDPLQGLSIPNDSLRRRLTMRRLRDVAANEMTEVVTSFRLRDASAPVITAVPLPDEAPGGVLFQSVRYTLLPVVENLDENPAAPFGDLEKVEYFSIDPTGNAQATPNFVATTAPFSYSFVAAYVGNGIDPRPLPIWVRATDTSTNASNVVQVETQVLPNIPPSAGSLTLASSRTDGITYAGSTVRATVDGLTDQDGASLTLRAELRQDGVVGYLAERTITVSRPAAGWPALIAPTLSLVPTIPLATPEGALLYVEMAVTDSKGATFKLESERFPVADDTFTPTQSVRLRVRRDGISTWDVIRELGLGQRFYLELVAVDRETAIKQVRLDFSRADLFAPIVLTTAGNSSGAWWTTYLTVPVGISNDVPITVTATIEDWGGNSITDTVDFTLKPSGDPYAPQIVFTSPWQGATWPADYSSVQVRPAIPLVVRAFVRDWNADAQGNQIPGSITQVRFKGPVSDGAGGFVLAADWTNAVLVAGSSGTGYGTYEMLWQIPNDLPVGTALPFAAEAFDTGAQSGQAAVAMTTVAYRQVFEGSMLAILPDDQMQGLGPDPSGPIFLLDGAAISIYPPLEGTPRRSLPSLILYSSATQNVAGLALKPTILSAPRITSPDSTVLYFPLELEVTGDLGVGGGSRVDLDGHGLLGGNATRPIEMPGIRGPAPGLGGSHGGFGGGTTGTGVETQNGEIYGNLKSPSLPGYGGRSTGTGTTGFGAQGGGVARLSAKTGTFFLGGDLLARGQDSIWVGGAGGSVFVEAQHLAGTGLIDVSGASAQTGNGAGGRISLRYRELADHFDLDRQARAEGGRIGGLPDLFSAGPGTIYLEQLDSEGRSTSAGTLRLYNERLLGSGFENLSLNNRLPALGRGTLQAVAPELGTITIPAAGVRGDVVGERIVLRTAEQSFGTFVIARQERIVTANGPKVELEIAGSEGILSLLASLGEPILFEGLTRLGSIELLGTDSVRLIVDDDIEFGPADNPSAERNDPAYVTVGQYAGILFASDLEDSLEFDLQPSISANTDIYAVATITLPNFKVNDGFGLKQVRWNWEGRNPTVVNFTTGPMSYSYSEAITVPLNQSGTPFTFTIEATTIDGRVKVQTLTWTVLPDAAPIGSVRVSPYTVLPVRVGTRVDFEVSAQDFEGLASINIAIAGSGFEAIGSATSTHSSSNYPVVRNFGFNASSSVVPGTYQATVTLTDNIGQIRQLPPLSFEVVPNVPSSLNIIPVAGTPNPITPGVFFSVDLNAVDDDGVASIELWRNGTDLLVVCYGAVPATYPTSFKRTCRIDVPASASAGQRTLIGSVRDRFDRILQQNYVVDVVASQPPTATVSFAAGTALPLTPGVTFELRIEAQDAEGLKRIEPVFDSGDFTNLTGRSAFDYSNTRPTSATETLRFRVAPSVLGSKTIAVRVTDMANQVLELPLVVEVAQSQPPTGSLRLADPSVAPIAPGEDFAVEFVAEDLEGLYSLQLVLSGTGFTTPSSTRLVSGLTATQVFNLVNPVTNALGPRTLTGKITDLAGQVFSVTLLVDIQASPAPTGSLSLLPGAPATAEPGTYVEMLVTGSDDLAGMLFELRVDVDQDGNTFEGYSSSTSFIQSARVWIPRYAVPGSTVNVTGELHDANNNVTQLPAVPITIIPDATPPTFESSYLPPVYAGLLLTDRYIFASDNAGIASLSVELGGTTRTIFAEPGDAWLTFELDELSFDPLTSSGPMTFIAVAVDVNGYTATQEFEIQVLENLPPELEVAVFPGLSVPPGVILELETTVTSDLFDLQSLSYSLSGVLTRTLTVPLFNARTYSETRNFIIPNSTPAGTLNLTVTAADRVGRLKVETFAIEVSSANDTPPSARFFLDPESGTDQYSAGSELTAIAIGEDDISVNSIELSAPGASASGGSAAAITVTLPVVSTSTPFIFTAEVVDSGGQSTSVTRTITVVPIADDAAPTVAFECPSSGATLPTGDTLTLNLKATDVTGIVRIDLFRDGSATPFTSLTPSGGSSANFVTQTTNVLPATPGSVVYRAEAVDDAGNVATAEITVDAVTTTNLSTTSNDWAALETQVAVLRSGTLLLDQPRTLGGLIVLSGASISHAAGGGIGSIVDLTVDGPVYIACGGAIDVTARGISDNQSWYSTKNLYRPTTPGNGGAGSAAGRKGGGVVALAAASVVVDGAIRANAESPATLPATLYGGDGGSIRIAAAGLLAGQGVIEAKGGPRGTTSGVPGSGGAITLAFGSSSGRVLELANAAAGSGGGLRGRNGTLLVKGPAAHYGSLVFGPATTADADTTLPSLGREVVAEEGSQGGTLRVYGLSVQVGGWVRIRTGQPCDPEFEYCGEGGGGPVGLTAPPGGGVQAAISEAAGNIEGIYRIESYDSETAILAANGPDDLPQVDFRDVIEPIYAFDALETRQRLGILATPTPSYGSPTTPVLVIGRTDFGEDLAVSGGFAALEAGELIVRSNARIMAKQQQYQVSGNVLLAPGAQIDASALGIGSVSHLGVGGGSSVETFDSVYEPNSAAGGGGAISIQAKSVFLAAPTSGIVANGGVASSGGAISVKADEIVGSGKIEARSTDRAGNTGGGGAIALDFRVLESAVAVTAKSGLATGALRGGAGTVLLRQPTSTWGDLIVDNGGGPLGSATVLPPFGVERLERYYDENGGEGSPNEAAEFTFCQADVEVEDDLVELGANRALQVSWQMNGETSGPYLYLTRRSDLTNERYIGEGTLAIPCVYLEPASGVEIPSNVYTLEVKGVYYFDNLTVQGSASFPSSLDLIEVLGQTTIIGDIAATEIRSGSFTIPSGVSIKPEPAATGAASKPIVVELTGDLVLESGSAIDASAQGYPAGFSFPGATAPGAGAGGSHIGSGGASAPALSGQTFGSLTQPLEAGSGGAGATGPSGGGVIKIKAANLELRGTAMIKANGGSAAAGETGAAGGSIAIEVTEISGSGAIQATGGSGNATGGGGGGGAIALRYATATGNVLDLVDARGGLGIQNGGAGSIYRFDDGTSVLGDLELDNASVAGASELPSVGSGTFGNEVYSSGFFDFNTTAETGARLVGRWIEVRDATSQLKGMWLAVEQYSYDPDNDLVWYPQGVEANPAAAIVLTDQVRLEPNTEFGTPEIEVGDAWQVVYRFDNLILWPNVTLTSLDPIFATNTLYPSPSTAAPEGLSVMLGGSFVGQTTRFEPAEVAIAATEVPGLYWIDVPAEAIDAGRGVSEVRVSDGFATRALAWREGGLGFFWSGRPGQVLTLSVVDAAPKLRSGAQILLPALPGRDDWPAELPALVGEPALDQLDPASWSWIDALGQPIANSLD